MAMPDVLVVGSGFAGAVLARRYAEEQGRRVLVLEKRAQIGGNMYDEPDENGVLVHRYGPHIFHTNSARVFAYLQRFSAFFPYEHRVLGKIKGRLVPIPFNFDSLEALFGPEKAAAIERRAAAFFPGQGKVSVRALLDVGDADVHAFGEYVYENVFRHYTAKQWGTDPANVDDSVLARVPVVLGRDGRYFQDGIQCMPAQGFTKLFEKLLDHPGITVETGADAASRLCLEPESGRILFDGQPFEGPVVYTGAVDELLDYCFGALPYRSLDLRFERLPVTQFQPAAVVNYPNEEDFTRITEFKYLTGQHVEGSTSILREYPLPYTPGAEKGGIPFYPVVGAANRALYEKYRGLVAGIPNLAFCGRLAEYKYYNMDAVVDRALTFPI